ncbi:hypothetical protein ACFVVA_23185 [Kitasatospora sp. NPDC058048]|uniref:hypothetical protein n=1 Tax=Kitasatospora sp. NPDC058048 TaxID=3346313 RepID=UPI0036DBA688
MQWGPDDEENEPADESGYLRELAAFLSARSGGGPAVLWTDYEPPVTGDPSAAEAAAALATGLSTLLGVTVRTLPQDPADPHAAQMRQADSEELLVLQLSSVTDILVGAPTASAASTDAIPGPIGSTGSSSSTASTDAHRVPLAVRLRGGQALFVPRRSTCTLLPEPGSRHAVLRIPTPRTGPGARPGGGPGPDVGR